VVKERHKTAAIRRHYGVNELKTRFIKAKEDGQCYNEWKKFLVYVAMTLLENVGR
jgi:hypothetical protein